MDEREQGDVRPHSAEADEIVARLERLPIGRFHVGLAGLLGVGTFFDAYDSIAIAVALAVIFQTLHISFLNTGILISIGFLGQFIGAIGFGILSERIGRKRAFLTALIIFGLCSLGTALSYSYWHLFWFRMVQGIGLGAEVPVAGALFNEYVQGKQRGKVVTIYESLFPWGLLLAPLVGFVLLSSLPPDISWRVLFAIGAIPVVWAVVGWFLLPESSRWLVDKGRIKEADAIVSRIEAGYERRGVSLAKPELRARADVKATRFGELFSPDYRRRTALCWIQWFMCYFIMYGYSTWLPGLYVRVGHLSPRLAVLLSAASMVMSLISAYVVASILDSVGRKVTFAVGFGISAVGGLLGVVLVGVFHVTGWPALFVVAMVMLVGANTNNIGVYTYTPELFPTRMRAWATSAASSMNRVASFLAPIFVGWLLGAGLGIGSIFLMFAVAAVIGMIGLITLGIETKQRTLEELSS